MNSYFQSAPINQDLSTIKNQQAIFCQKQRTSFRLPRCRSAYHKYIAYTIFLLISFFFCVSPARAEVEHPDEDGAEAGYVITTDNGQIYLNLGAKHGVKMGMLFRVYRPLFNVYRPEENATVDIGKIKVTQVSYEASAASILSQESDMEIMAGDRIEIIPPDEQSDEQLALPKLDNKSNNHKIHWLLLQTGIVALGSAGYFHQLADESYSKYKKANTSDEALSHRQKIELNDKRTKIAWGVSLALISISAYLWKGDTVEEHDSFISKAVMNDCLFLGSHLKSDVNYNEIRWRTQF